MTDSIENAAADDIRLTFDRVPELYTEIRPSYPDQLFDALFAALPDEPTICEVGPGTGQATRSLLSRGAHVTAVEIGPHLAEALDAQLGCAELMTIIAEFETAVLSPASFDAVVSATAYHWVEPSVRCTRPAEVLKPGGCLAVIDLIQVDSTADRGYFDRVTSIYDSFGLGSDSVAPTADEAMPYMAAELNASNLFDDPIVHRVAWDQTYTTDEYRKLLLTYSGTHMVAEPARSDLVGQLIAVIDDEFDGSITRPLIATLTTAERRA